jgi:hypothetical protein
MVYIVTMIFIFLSKSVWIWQNLVSSSHIKLIKYVCLKNCIALLKYISNFPLLCYNFEWHVMILPIQFVGSVGSTLNPASQLQEKLPTVLVHLWAQVLATASSHSSLSVRITNDWFITFLLRCLCFYLKERSLERGRWLNFTHWQINKSTTIFFYLWRFWKHLTLKSK